jgi:hypothetical protein
LFDDFFVLKPSDEGGSDQPREILQASVKLCSLIYSAGIQARLFSSATGISLPLVAISTVNSARLLIQMMTWIK